MLRKIRKSFALAWLVVLTSQTFVFAQLPTGAQVVAGQATFNQTGNNLNITTSDKVIINYQDFSIGQPNAVNFYQPSSSSVALNRVVGGDPSSILGTLNANGQIFLVNPNGIIFGAGSRVDAAGLVASTLDISNQDFLNGNYNFSKVGNNAVIDNRGNIQIINGGYVGLLAGAVKNSGTIEAQTGSVALASGEEMTVNLDDLGQISVVVSKAVQNDVFDADGNKVDVAVENTGLIVADGGTIQLSAKVLDTILDNAINNEGVIQAASLVNKDGVIELTAEGAKVNNEGLVSSKYVSVNSDDKFTNTGTISSNGGLVSIFAHYVWQLGNVLADVQEGTAGQVDLISLFGTLVGSGSVTSAKVLGQHGQGGTMEINSLEGSTLVEPNAVINISAGSQSGDAGFVEISAKEQLGLYSPVVGDAAEGYQKGHVFIDPRDITIQNGGGDVPSRDVFPGADEGTGDNIGIDLVIDTAVLLAMTAQEILLQATRDIFINSDLLNVATSIVLEAFRHIEVNANVSTLGHDITMRADADSNSNGKFTMAGGTSINSNGGQIDILSAGKAIIKTFFSGTGDINITTTDGDVEVDSVVSAGTVTIDSAKKIDEDVNDDAGVDIVGAVVDLTAVSGIGKNRAPDISTDDLSAEVTGSGKIDLDLFGPTTKITKAVTVDGNIVLEAKGGDAEVVTITAGNNKDVTLNATSGKIDSGDVSNKITAKKLDVTTKDGFGGNAQINTEVETVEIEVTSSGNVDISETDAIKLKDITTADGDIVVTASGDIEVEVVNAGARDVGLNSGGAVTDGGSDLITADELTIFANDGIGSGDAIKTDVNEASLTNTGVGDIEIVETDAIDLVDVKTADGSIDIEADGDITATSVVSQTDSDTNDIALTAKNGGDILVDTINAGNLGDVTLTANTAGGEILAKNTLVTADELELKAKAGIGTSVKRLETDVNKLNASVTGAGDMYISEANSIELTDVDTSNGLIDITSGGAMDAKDVKAGGAGNNVTLTATTGDVTVGDIIANGDTVTITASDGSILGDGDLNTEIKADTVVLNALAASGAIGSGVFNPSTIIYTNANFLNLAAGTGGIGIIDNGSVTLSSVTVGADGNVIIFANNDLSVDTGVATTGFGQLILLAGWDFSGNDKFTQNVGNDLTSEYGAILVGTLGSGSAKVARVASANSNVQVISVGGDIKETASGSSSIEGGFVQFVAGAGAGNTIGTNADAINTTSNSLAASAGGDIHIEESDGTILQNVVTTADGDIDISSLTGDLEIVLVDAGAGDVDLDAVAGSILAYSTHVAGNVVTLNAGGVNGSIGESNKFLETESNTLNLTANGGGIYVTEADGTQIGVLNPNGGDTIINNLAGLLQTTQAIDTNGGNITLTSLGGLTIGDTITAMDANIVLKGFNLVLTSLLTAGTGNITLGGMNGANMDIGFTGGAGDIQLSDLTISSLLSNTGKIIFGSAETGNIVLDTVNLATRDVDLITRQGSITGSAGIDIAALNLNASALNGINIDTLIQTLVASNVNNDIVISNTGMLSVNGVTNINGNIDITASSPLTVNSAVVAGGDVVLTATNDGGNDDDLTVNADVKSTGGGLIDLNAGTDFTQFAGEISTSGNIDIDAVNDAVQNGGSIISTAGNVDIDSGRDVTQNGGKFEAVQLTLNGTRNIKALQADNDADSLIASSSVDGDIEYNDKDDVNLLNVVANDGKIDVTAGGTITATNVVSSTDHDDNDITLTATAGNIGLANVNAGTTAGDVIVDAQAGAVTDAGAGTVTAEDLIITAVNGVGDGDAVETAVTNLDVTNVNNNIEIANTGELNLVDLGAGDPGSINNGAGDIIISAASPLNVNADVTGQGDITLSAANDGGNNDHLTVDANVQTLNGKITFNAGEDFIQNSGLIKTGGEVEINALQDDAKQTGGHIEADLLDVNAQNVIDLQSAANDVNTLEAFSDQSGNIDYVDVDDVILANVTNDNGDITITAGGTLTAQYVESKATGADDVTLITTSGDILVDYIESQDDVNLQSAGAIEETGIDAGNDIDAKHLIFTAQSGVGHLNTLETAVNDVTGTNVTNDINLVNDGDLIVKQVTNTNGNIDIQANSPLTVNQAVTAGGTIDLTSTGNDNLTVNADVQSTGGGKITLNAGEDFVQNAGLIKTSTEVEINALQDDAKQTWRSH
jgi:filamentous hemagglutinin family protein